MLISQPFKNCTLQIIIKRRCRWHWTLNPPIHTSILALVARNDATQSSWKSIHSFCETIMVWNSLTALSRTTIGLIPGKLIQINIENVSLQGQRNHIAVYQNTLNPVGPYLIIHKSTLSSSGGQSQHRFRQTIRWPVFHSRTTYTV